MTAEDSIGKLSLEDFQEYFSTFDKYTDPDGNEQYYDAATKARKVISLRSFCKYLFKIGELPRDLSAILDVPQTKTKVIVPLAHEDVSALLSSVRDTEGLSGKTLENKAKTMDRDYAIMMLLFGTGIRVSELVGIDLSQVDLFNASIIVTRKGGNQDVVFFGQAVQSALENYIKNSRPALLGKNHNPALFLSLRHSRITVRAVELLTKSYGEKIGLDKLGRKANPHAFRKTFGTALYEETGDIYMVADALHHKSVETTKQHYAKLGENKKRAAALTADKLFDD